MKFAMKMTSNVTFVICKKTVLILVHFRKKAALLKKGDSSDLDIDSAQLQTAQDFKDACVEELVKFQFANRLTDADKKNDLKSLERKLDQHLVLVTQQEVGKKKHFLLPQGIRQEGESLRQVI